VAEGSSLEAVCAESCGVVDRNPLREQLNRGLEAAALRQQEAELKAALPACLPVGMPRGGLEGAAETKFRTDTHDEPFYGKTPELRADTCKPRAKAGTTRFFGSASA
jgi:hypothetical protein